MEDLVVIIAILGGILGILVVSVVVTNALHRKRDAEWSGWAAARGFSKGGDYPNLRAEGVHADVPVEIVLFTRTRGSGKNRRVEHWTAISGTPPVPTGDLAVFPTGFFSWLAEGVGLANDVVMGDAGFDERFSIRCTDLALPLTVLGPAARAALIETRGGDGQLTIEGGRVVWKRQASLRPGPELDAQLARVATVARALGS